MPLGVQQNNDFTQFTMDVWNDKIFYQEKEFPAGFMAMSILNIPEEELPELIQAGGAPTFLFPVVVQGSDEEAAAVRESTSPNTDDRFGVPDRVPEILRRDHTHSYRHVSLLCSGAVL